MIERLLFGVFLIIGFGISAQEIAEKDLVDRYFLTEGGDSNNFFHKKSQEFINFIVKNKLQNKEDVRFISKRESTSLINMLECDTHQIVFFDTLKSGETCKIIVKTGRFNVANHVVNRSHNNSFNNSIDNQVPFGGGYEVPTCELKEISIFINEKEVLIPVNSYSNLYQPNTCYEKGFYRKIEAYTSSDSEFIYLYIYGGVAADTYFAKLIFNKEKYITRIIADYETLSSFGSFRSNFRGF